MFDLQTPFFLPKWRRVAVVLVCILWGGFEFANANTFWGLLFCAIACYASWQFFFSGWPDKTKPP